MAIQTEPYITEDAEALLALETAKIDAILAAYAAGTEIDTTVNPLLITRVDGVFPVIVADSATDYLAEIARLIELYPDCGGWCSGFDIVSEDGTFAGDTPQYEGVVEDYFAEAMKRYVCITSATTIARRVFDEVGGFPVGMRMGQDTYMWIKLARSYRVATTPKRLCRYNRAAQNRTPSIYRGDDGTASFRDFYTAGREPMLDEYAARIGLSRAIIISAKGGTEEARDTERFFSYTKMNRRILRKLQVINRLPVAWRWNALRAYNWLAWKIARKGL